MNIDHADESSTLIHASKVLYDKNILVATDGNLSLRLNDGEILITPRGVSKKDIHINEIAIVNIEGKVLRGNPSTELPMHLEVYRLCKQAKAVIHAHPPSPIAYSLAFPKDEELPVSCLPEVAIGLGRVPIAKYARTGTEALANSISMYLPRHRALILSRHGALTWGESLLEALWGMERLEHSSAIILSALHFGPLTQLPADEIRALQELHQTNGGKLR